MKTVVSLRRFASYPLILVPNCRAISIFYTGKTIRRWVLINIPRTWRIVGIKVSVSTQTEALVNLRPFVSHEAIQTPNDR